MIIDLQRFIESARPGWNELESILARLEDQSNVRMSIRDTQRFHELYELVAADLAKLTTFSSEPETRRYLESLVSRAYGEIYETRDKRRRFFPIQWLFKTFPQTFRRHIRAFYLSLAITLAGTAFGGLATAFDPESRHVTMPFGLDNLRPRDRVKQEESGTTDRLAGSKGTFSASLMTHNIQVSITTLAFGATWGVGTILLLFYNGVSLGAIAVDYIGDGQTKFLLGWLMPHGVIEIPAIIIAGQAGLALASGFIGWGKRTVLGSRLREVSRDVTTLSFGFALLLVWAGFVESFLSQYHEPIIPYNAKIALGTVEFLLLVLFLTRSGSASEK
ncbi:MAG TPA: stage II sporulation protein M [Terriglobia bacterium]|nr:stage II sporulation protein M [Terriglobia bacterium]